MYMYEKQTRACLLMINGKNSTFRLLSSRFGPFLSLLCTRVSANIPSYKFSFVNSAALRCIGTDDTHSLGRQGEGKSVEGKERESIARYRQQGIIQARSFAGANSDFVLFASRPKRLAYNVRRRYIIRRSEEFLSVMYMFSVCHFVMSKRIFSGI